MTPFRALKIPLDYRKSAMLGWVTADGLWVPDEKSEFTAGLFVPIRPSSDTPTIPPPYAKPQRGRGKGV